ncbi:MAG: hypothetical protein KJO58_02935, partial [Gammaproteobacteria bacterium]|nr:hypothetical protein [Gammaproteobacteria bacterium]
AKRTLPLPGLEAVSQNQSWVHSLRPTNQLVGLAKPYNRATDCQQQSLGVAYSDDYYGGTSSFWYLQAGYDWGFAENWALSLHAGYNYFEEDSFLSSDKGHYVDYSVGVT